MIKNTILSKTIAAAASLVLCVTAASAASLINGTNGTGELLLGFRATGGTGATTNVVIDLGSAAGFSALATGSVISLGNIGSDLSTAFSSIGSGNWYDRSDVLWSAVAGNASGDVNTNTVYGSRSGTGLFPLSSTGPARVANNTQGGYITNILSAASGSGGFTTSTTGSLSNVAIESTTTNPNSWTARAGASFGSPQFSGNGGLEQAFGTGTLPTSGVEGALDIYRVVRSSAADPDNGNAITGNGSYQITLSINSAGDITGSVLPVAVPEPASIGMLTSLALFGVGAMRRKRGAKA